MEKDLSDALDDLILGRGMALQRPGRLRVRSGRSLRSFSSPLTVRPLDANRKEPGHG